MEVLHARCAGLDVDQATVVACVRRATRKAVRREPRDFGTCTRDLLALGDWLQHARGQPRRDGVDGGRTGSPSGMSWPIVCGRPRQCDRCAQRARAQERRQRCGVVGVSARAWLIRPSFVPTPRRRNSGVGKPWDAQDGADPALASRSARASISTSRRRARQHACDHRRRTIVALLSPSACILAASNAGASAKHEKFTDFIDGPCAPRVHVARHFPRVV